MGRKLAAGLAGILALTGCNAAGEAFIRETTRNAAMTTIYSTASGFGSEAGRRAAGGKDTQVSVYNEGSEVIRVGGKIPHIEFFVGSDDNADGNLNRDEFKESKMVSRRTQVMVIGVPYDEEDYGLATARITSPSGRISEATYSVIPGRIFNFRFSGEGTNFSECGSYKLIVQMWKLDDNKIIDPSPKFYFGFDVTE